MLCFELFFKNSPWGSGLLSVLCSIPLYLSAHWTDSTALRPGEMTTCPRSCALETQLLTLSRCSLSPGWNVYGPMRCGHPEPIILLSRPHSCSETPGSPATNGAKPAPGILWAFFLRLRWAKVGGSQGPETHTFTAPMFWHWTWCLENSKLELAFQVIIKVYLSRYKYERIYLAVFGPAFHL